MEYTRKTYAIIDYVWHNTENDSFDFRVTAKEVDSSLRDLPEEKILKQLQIITSEELKDSTVLYFYFYDVFEAEIVFEGKKITLTSSQSGRKWGLRDYEANKSRRYFNCINGGILYSAEECKTKLGIDTNKEFGWFSEKLFIWFDGCKKLFLFIKEHDVIVTEE